MRAPPSPILLALAITVAGAASAAAAGPPTFDPDEARPYFTTGPAAAALERFRVEAFGDAARLFDAWLAAHPRAADRNQAAFFAACAHSRAGHFLDAARRFDALVRTYPLLADHHRLYAARAWLAAKQHAAALERARAIPADSPLDGEARMLRADAHRLLRDRAAAEKEYRGYIEAYPESWRLPEASFRLAESIAADAARWKEAAPRLVEVLTRWPTQTWGEKARELVRAHDHAEPKLDGHQRLVRGVALFDAMHNVESEAELRAALASGDLDARDACLAAYDVAQSVFKQRDRPRAAPLFDAAVATCEKAPATDATVADLHMKALYQGGRCHAARGEPAIAVALFARAEKEHPTHSYADDARLRQAEVYADLAAKGRAPAHSGSAVAVAPRSPSPAGAPPLPTTPDASEARELALLSDLAERYPSGDVVSEALFRLFFVAWRAGRLDDAQRWLATLREKVPRETGWWDAGRTLYWSGRLASRRGDDAGAREHYARCAREYPLSYHSLQALTRLREISPAAAAHLVEELRHPAPTAADLAWTFRPRALFATPAFRRGVELARLGLGAEAKRELAAAGIHAPIAKGATVASPDEEELLWLAAVLFDRAGEYAHSHAIPRHVLTAYERQWPVGANRKRWLLSYPRAYAELIVENTAKTGQPAALEMAIVREESAFDPLTVSFANAVGLTQLTPPPAERFAEGLPHTREALFDPAINIAIGARELGYEWSYYKGDAALAIAAYNAGEGAVNRWLRAAPAGTTLDELVESIPYDETRGYTKRVLASFFAYRWLYEPEDPVPALPSALPTKR